MKKLLRHLPLMLCLMHLLPAAAVVLLEHSGWHIWQAHRPWFHWLLAAVTSAAAVHALLHKPAWNKLNNAAALILPLCCIADIAFAAGHQTQIWLPSLACMLASMPIFACGKTRWFCKLPLCVLSMLVLFFFGFGTFLETVGFEPQITTLSEISPDGDKIAVVECIDEGALGGRTQGYVYRYNPDAFSDQYIRYGTQVMDIAFLYPGEIVLYWKDNDTVLMNNGLHHAGDILK